MRTTSCEQWVVDRKNKKHFPNTEEVRKRAAAPMALKVIYAFDLAFRLRLRARLDYGVPLALEEARSFVTVPKG